MTDDRYLSAKAVFAHHDKIAASPRGSILITAEPVRAQVIPDGNVINLAEGEYLRAQHVTSHLYCEVVVDRKVLTVIIDKRDFGALEQQPVTA